MTNEEIADKLNALYDWLDKKRKLTQYTVHEGEQSSKRAARLVEAWQPRDEQDEAAKATALDSFREVIAATYDIKEPSMLLTEAQDAIELFLHEIGKNISDSRQ